MQVAAVIVVVYMECRKAVMPEDADHILHLVALFGGKPDVTEVKAGFHVVAVKRVDVAHELRRL